jgi:shikimate dehydrogenase
MGADRYCVFGNPISHSKSPAIHAAFAAQTGQDISYERRLAPLDGFADAVRQFVASGGKGANVTVPFKLDACALADCLTPRARAAGAVNTLSFNVDRDGSIAGDNTDGAGLVRDIEYNAKLALAGRRVLLVGAGGAARGVILPLLERGPFELVIANRTAATADALALQFTPLAAPGVLVRACEFGALEAGFDIVINATSASLDGALPPLPPAVFGSHTLALDMMYGAAPTVFMQFAASHGACVRDGLGMLVEQAAEAFFIWRGVRPETADLLAHMRGQA